MRLNHLRAFYIFNCWLKVYTQGLYSSYKLDTLTKESNEQKWKLHYICRYFNINYLHSLNFAMYKYLIILLSIFPRYCISRTHPFKWPNCPLCKHSGRDCDRGSHPSVTPWSSWPSHTRAWALLKSAREASGPELGRRRWRAGFQQSWCHSVETKPDVKKDERSSRETPKSLNE